MLHEIKHFSLDGVALLWNMYQTDPNSHKLMAVSCKVCPHQSMEQARFNLAAGPGAPNIIPDAVELSGTVRALTAEHFERLKRRVAQVCSPVCVATCRQAWSMHMSSGVWSLASSCTLRGCHSLQPRASSGSFTLR